MKGRNGILVLLALLFLLPLTADLVLFFFVNKSLINWGMTKMLYAGYPGMLPLFVLHLIITFIILYLIKVYRKNRSIRK